MIIPRFTSVAHSRLLSASLLLLSGQFLLACGSDPVAAPGVAGAAGVAAAGSAGANNDAGSAAGTGGVGSVGGSSGAGGTTATSNILPLPAEDRTPAPERAGFTLLWQDDFDSLNGARWGKGTHTFTENAAQFANENVTAESGFLKLSLTKREVASPEGKLYSGGELRTLDAFTYGRFETRARFAKGSGVVSSLFTYYDHWGNAALPENWNEIDVEFLGKDTDSVQFNVIHWNASNIRTTHEEHSTTAFDPSDDFHIYAVEWLPEVINFYIDDVLVHSNDNAVASFIKLESKLMMNVWAVHDTPNLNGWAGKFDEASLPTAAYYDWVRVYSYDAP